MFSIATRQVYFDGFGFDVIVSIQSIILITKLSQISESAVEAVALSSNGHRFYAKYLITRTVFFIGLITPI